MLVQSPDVPCGKHRCSPCWVPVDDCQTVVTSCGSDEVLDTSRMILFWLKSHCEILCCMPQILLEHGVVELGDQLVQATPHTGDSFVHILVPWHVDLKGLQDHIFETTVASSGLVGYAAQLVLEEFFGQGDVVARSFVNAAWAARQKSDLFGDILGCIRAPHPCVVPSQHLHKLSMACLHLHATALDSQWRVPDSDEAA